MSAGAQVMSTRSARDVEGGPMIRTWLVVKVAEYLAPDARQQLLSRASPRLRALLGRQRDDRENWAPIAWFQEALELADAVAGHGDLQDCWSIGRFTAHGEVGPVRSFALKMLRPSTVLSLTTSLWQVHYRNAGRVVTQVAGPDAIKLSVVGYPSPHRGHCLAVGGWIQGVLELGPRCAIRVQKVGCRCDGGLTCDYSVSWQGD